MPNTTRCNALIWDAYTLNPNGEDTARNADGTPMTLKSILNLDEFVPETDMNAFGKKYHMVDGVKYLENKLRLKVEEAKVLVGEDCPPLYLTICGRRCEGTKCGTHGKAIGDDFQSLVWENGMSTVHADELKKKTFEMNYYMLNCRINKRRLTQVWEKFGTPEEPNTLWWNARLGKEGWHNCKVSKAEKPTPEELKAGKNGTFTFTTKTIKCKATMKPDPVEVSPKETTSKVPKSTKTKKTEQESLIRELTERDRQREEQMKIMFELLAKNGITLPDNCNGVAVFNRPLTAEEVKTLKEDLKSEETSQEECVYNCIASPEEEEDESISLEYLEEFKVWLDTDTHLYYDTQDAVDAIGSITMTGNKITGLKPFKKAVRSR